MSANPPQEAPIPNLKLKDRVKMKSNSVGFPEFDNLTGVVVHIGPLVHVVSCDTKVERTRLPVQFYKKRYGELMKNPAPSALEKAMMLAMSYTTIFVPKWEPPKTDTAGKTPQQVQKEQEDAEKNKPPANQNRSFPNNDPLVTVEFPTKPKPRRLTMPASTLLKA